MGDRPLLRVRDLSVRFFAEAGQINAVESVSFDVRRGEAFGVVGESGAGKSVTALTVMGLLENPGRVTAGQVWYHDPDLAGTVAASQPEAVDGEDVDLLQLPETTRRSLRGTTFGMVFQDPMTSMNPSVTVGEQIAEAVEIQRRARANPRATRSRTQGFSLGNLIAGALVPSKRFVRPESRERAVDLLAQVGIPDPAERADQYPHEFSGGMLQRAMIAQALAGEPEVLIADEPTTALDVTIQAQILDLLVELQRESEMSIVVITHNLGITAQLCDRVGVMYAGEIVERGTPADIFEDPVHPYTRGLIGSIPDPANPRPRLQPIEGTVPDLLAGELGDRCYFADRCPKAMEVCNRKPPEFTVSETGDETGGMPTHGVKCYLADGDFEHDERPGVASVEEVGDD